MKVLVTGATGQLGREVLSMFFSRGYDVDIISRNVEKAQKAYPKAHAIIGDITVPGLGKWESFADYYDAFYHMAADVNLGSKHEDRIFATNLGGTENVTRFCRKKNIPHLYLVSTAYTIGRNAYEKSKIASEDLALNSGIPQVTILKPSVLVPSFDFLKPTLGAFYQFAQGVCILHKRAEIVRRAVEGALTLPILRPKFRIEGNPDGKINLVPVDKVADFIVNNKDTGTFWLTHPNPETVGNVGQWMGEALYVDVEFKPKFKMSAIEKVFHRGAVAFKPYLQGDNFPSNLEGVPPITREYIIKTVTENVLRVS